ncbi:MAG TPA: hypothetical protein VJU16_04000 [Planctomycetota bacterium]|nr:hypothetical protein [Planctomycetota bacterium]
MGETSKVALIVVGAICALIIGGGGILWVVKAVVSGLIRQNKQLVDNTIDSIKAQTIATNANTAATQALSASLHQQIAVGHERDKNMFKQLDRIETGVRHRRPDPPGHEHH